MGPVEMPVKMITSETMGRCTMPVLDDHGDRFGVPSLEELGKNPKIVTKLNLSFILSKEFKLNYNS